MAFDAPLLDINTVASYENMEFEDGYGLYELARMFGSYYNSDNPYFWLPEFLPHQANDVNMHLDVTPGTVITNFMI